MKNQRTQPQKPYPDGGNYANLNLKRVADLAGKTVEGQEVQPPVILSAEIGLAPMRKSAEKRAQPSMALPEHTGNNTQTSSTTNMKSK